MSTVWSTISTYLPQHPGLLPKWLWFVSVYLFSSFIYSLCYHLHYTTPSPIIQAIPPYPCLYTPQSKHIYNTTTPPNASTSAPPHHRPHHPPPPTPPPPRSPPASSAPGPSSRASCASTPPTTSTTRLFISWPSSRTSWHGRTLRVSGLASRRRGGGRGWRGRWL